MPVPTSPSSEPGPSGRVQALIVGVMALVAMVMAFSVALAGRVS